MTPEERFSRLSRRLWRQVGRRLRAGSQGAALLMPGRQRGISVARGSGRAAEAYRARDRLGGEVAERWTWCCTAVGAAGVERGCCCTWFEVNGWRWRDGRPRRGEGCREDVRHRQKLRVKQRKGEDERGTAQSCAVMEKTAGQRLCVRRRAADSTSESSNMGHLECGEVSMCVRRGTLLPQ